MSKSKAARGRIGSSFEDFLKETGDYDAVTKAALKDVVVWQLEQAREDQGVTKAALAARMKTSRSQLNRLLDPKNDDVTLAALERAAAALGHGLRLELVKPPGPVRVKAPALKTIKPAAKSPTAPPKLATAAKSSKRVASRLAGSVRAAVRAPKKA